MTYAQNESERNHPHIWSAEQSCTQKGHHSNGETCILQLRVVEYPVQATTETLDSLEIVCELCNGDKRHLILPPAPARYLLHALEYFLPSLSPKGYVMPSSIKRFLLEQVTGARQSGCSSIQFTTHSVCDAMNLEISYAKEVRQILESYQFLHDADAEMMGHGCVGNDRTYGFRLK